MSTAAESLAFLESEMERTYNQPFIVPPRSTPKHIPRPPRCEATYPDGPERCIKPAEHVGHEEHMTLIEGKVRTW